MIGRIQFGLHHALSSRYNTMIIPLYLGLFYLLLLTIKKIKFIRIFLYFYLIILILGYLSGAKRAVYELNLYAFKKGTDAWRSCFLKYENIEKCDKLTSFKIYPNAKAIQLENKIKLLKKYRMNIYGS